MWRWNYKQRSPPFSGRRFAELSCPCVSPSNLHTRRGSGGRSPHEGDEVTGAQRGCSWVPRLREAGPCGPRAGATCLQAVIMSSPSQPWLSFLPEKTRGAWHRQPCRLPLCLSLHQAPECGHRALPPRCPARWQQCEASRWLLRGARSPGPGALIHQAAASRGEGMPRAAERCTWEDRTKTEQFSRRVKTAKIHPRGSSRNMNRPQTQGETAKVVKGLTPRMVKARHAALERGGMDRSRAGSWRGHSAAPGRAAERREELPRQNPALSGRGGRGPPAP